MARTEDELRLKVSSVDYQTQLGLMDGKISDLRTLLIEYNTLRSEATQVMGDSDSNLEKLQAAVDQNIKAVQGQLNLLQQSREMLQEQNEALGIKSTEVGTDLTNTMETAKSMLGVIKAVKDIVG